MLQKCPSDKVTIIRYNKCTFFLSRAPTPTLRFCSTKSMDSLTLKRHNSFQNKNNRKTTDSFAPRPLTFKLQQELLKF